MKVKTRKNGDIEVKDTPLRIRIFMNLKISFFLLVKIILIRLPPPTLPTPHFQHTMICTCCRLASEQKNVYSWSFNSVVFIFRRGKKQVRLQILNIYVWCFINFPEPSIVNGNWVLGDFVWVF